MMNQNEKMVLAIQGYTKQRRYLNPLIHRIELCSAAGDKMMFKLEVYIEHQRGIRLVVVDDKGEVTIVK